MTDENAVQIVNRDGKLIAVNPETGKTVPIAIGVTSIGSASIGEATINERNLTLGKDSATNRDDTTVIGGGGEYEHDDDADDGAHNEGEAVVIGTDAYADTGWSVTIGHGAESRLDENNDGDSTVAIGRRATAKGHSNVAIGRHAEAVETYRATAIGRGAHSSGAHSVGLGYHWDAEHDGAEGADSIAIGRASARVNNSVAIGVDSETDDGASIAIGNSATAHDTRSVAIGESAKATGSSSVAIGRGAETDHWNSVAIGRGAQTDGQHQIMLGTDGENFARLTSNGLEISGELTENADI